MAEVSGRGHLNFKSPGYGASADFSKFKISSPSQIVAAEIDRAASQSFLVGPFQLNPAWIRNSDAFLQLSEAALPSADVAASFSVRVRGGVSATATKTSAADAG